MGLAGLDEEVPVLPVDLVVRVLLGVERRLDGQHPERGDVAHVGVVPLRQTRGVDRRGALQDGVGRQPVHLDAALVAGAAARPVDARGGDDEGAHGALGGLVRPQHHLVHVPVHRRVRVRQDALDVPDVVVDLPLGRRQPEPPVRPVVVHQHPRPADVQPVPRLLGRVACC